MAFDLRFLVSCSRVRPIGTFVMFMNSKNKFSVYLVMSTFKIKGSKNESNEGQSLKCGKLKYHLVEKERLAYARTRRSLTNHKICVMTSNKNR